MAEAGNHSMGSVGPGTVVGGAYRIERPLAEGGMGSVFVATQLGTERQRALKLMLPELSKHGKLRERFHQEARIGAKIHSDHVVEVVDAGIDEDSGMPYIAMELLEGHDLEELVQSKGPLAPSEVLRLFGELCHALTAAHAQGIFHRDLKPANLFLAKSRRADGKPVLKILDFGIAKVVAEARTRAGNTGQIGSPMWMAPEQTMPGAPITPGTDIWAAGLIAFFLLTGRVFWKSAYSQGATPMMVMREVGFEPIAPATTRVTEVGASAASLPAGFDAWFARCVVREQDERFATADEMLRALEPVLRRAGASAPVAATQEQAPTVKTAPGTPPAGVALPVAAARGTVAKVASNTAPMAPAATPPRANTTTSPTVRPPAPTSGGGRMPLIVAGVVGLLSVGTLAAVLAGDEPDDTSTTSAAPAARERRPRARESARRGEREAPTDSEAQTPSTEETAVPSAKAPAPGPSDPTPTGPVQPPSTPEPGVDKKAQKARLYNKVASGNASESEIRQLKALCMLDGDRACRNMCVAALKNKQQ